MGTTPITFDLSKSIPITPADPSAASALQGAVSYSSGQDPDQYAKLLRFQELTGVPPALSSGNEQQVKHAADVNAVNYPQFAVSNPRTTAWASNPDNAAVSGVDEIHRLGGIEQNAATMRAYTPTTWDKVTDKLYDLGQWMMGGTMTKGQLRQNFYQGPITRGAMDIGSGVSGMAGNVGSFFGWHGDGPTKPNLLQRAGSNLDPANAGVYANGQVDPGNQFDWLMKNVAPMVPAVLASGGVSAVANALKLSPMAAKVLAGLAVGGLFDADQAGKTYTAVAESGGSDYDARLAANRVAMISALPNAAFGATDVVPLLRDNPLLTSLGLGGATGASGQIGQNVVTGQPWAKGVPSSMVQGAAMQGGMHLGMEGFAGPKETQPLSQTPIPEGFSAYFNRDSYLGNIAEAVGSAEVSKLRERAPDKFYEATQAHFEGDQSLRIPSDQFSAYFKDKGIDPAEVANGLGSTNYTESVLSGGDVEVPTADYLSKLDPEHQKALLPHIVDPSTGMTARQHLQGREELERWVTEGGPEKLQAEAAQTDAETAATPEWQGVKEDLRQRYIDAGETPEVAETLATKDAHVYSNLAKKAGMKPSELLSYYNPKVVLGEDPGQSAAEQVLHQERVESIRSVVQAAKEEGHAPQKAVIAPVHPWMVEAAKNNGLDIDGYNHVIDGSAVRHALNRHGNEAIEASRGQLPISDADFDRIPDIIDSPDQVVLGTKTKGHKDQIGYMKRLEDGTTLYLEEARTGKKELATVSMRKYPATKDFDAITDTLPSNARSDGGNNPIIVQPPGTGKTDSFLHQSAPENGQPRGWFRVLPDGTYEIGRTKIGDLSTFVHEPAHGYLQIIRDLAAREGASETIKGDYGKILDFLGAKEGDTLTREQQEKWARANEQYLREGKAPSQNLKGVFQRFAIWLGSVYKKASDLGVELNDDIRGVLDRMYASEDGVDRAAQESGPKLFTTPEEAGWTDEEFTKYAEARGLEVEQAKAEILTKLNEAATRERTEDWREEERNSREALTTEIDRKPEYQAIRSLRRGATDDGSPITMSREALVDKFGEDRVKALQRVHPGLYRNEGGVEPDTVAEMFGFHSAAEMMSALEQSPRRSEAINTAVRDYMTAKHGDIRYDGSLHDQANIALMNEERARNLYRELSTLSRRNNPEFELREAQRELKRYQREKETNSQAKEATRTARDMESLANTLLDETTRQQRQIESRDQKIADLKQKIEVIGQSIKDAKQENRAGNRFAQAVAPIDSYREAAHQMIESKAVADLQPTRYLDASRIAARDAFKALAKGDYWEAKQAKHKELMNHFLFREANKAKEYIGNFESYVKRVQTKGVQAKLGLAGSDYRDQFNRLMFRYGLGEPPTQAPERTLAEWASDLYDQGTEPAIDAAMYNESRSINYRQASVAEVRNLHEALINIRHIALQELGMEVNGRKVEFNAALENLSARARESIKSTPRPILDENRSTGMKWGDFVNRGTALLARTEFLMKRLDGGTSGPWHDNLWNLAADAQGRESALQEEVTKSVGDALQNMPKEQRKKLLDKVEIDGVSEPMTRRTMLAVAFNMGNEGNLDRLEKTFIANGWDPRAIEKIKGTLTREEWQFVQGAWDSLKPLGQAQSEMEKRLTGLPPLMVRPTPLHIELADGSEMNLDGGYYPIVMDPKRSTRGAQQDASMTAQNMMEAGYGRAVTSRGAMKERTGFGGPLQLDYEQVLTQHTAKVIKDITHREFMLAANKLLMDPQTRQTLSETLGVGNEAQMMPWLRTIINDRNGSTVQGLGDVSKAMDGLRTNVVKAALGFKFSTTLLQLTHASSIFLHTSPGSYAQAMIDFVAHPLNMSEEIRNLSPNEMATRGENLDRDMRTVLRDGIEKKSIGDIWAKTGWAPVQFMDHMLSFPLWLSVYRDALAANVHLPEDEAQYQAMHKADGAVRMGLGSNAPKDLAPIMRKNDATKLLTTMGGFHNLKWNQMADVANQFKSDRQFGKLTYGMLMAAIIPAVMGPLITGRGPKDGESKGAWAAKRALLFPAETMAIANIVVDALENHGDIRFSPVVTMLERGTKAGVHAQSDKDDKDWTGIGMDALQSAMEGFGVSGTDQTFKFMRYGRKAQQGKIEKPNAWDAVAGEQHKN